MSVTEVFMVDANDPEGDLDMTKTSETDKSSGCGCQIARTVIGVGLAVATGGTVSIF